MCSRISQTAPVEALRQLFDFDERPNLRPRVNIAPTQEVPAVRLEADEGEPAASRRHLVMLRWGLIPSWAKDAKLGSRMINARAETVATKPAFRAAFRRRRCLLLADGFYEWRQESGGKQPYRVALNDGGPFAFAGLWEAWCPPAEDTRLESCTIITTDANDLLGAIHDRMPVILDPKDYRLWLDDRAPLTEVQALLRPFPSEALTAFPVSKRLNSVANEAPDLIEPTGPALEETTAEDTLPWQPRLL